MSVITSEIKVIAGDITIEKGHAPMDGAYIYGMVLAGCTLVTCTTRGTNGPSAHRSGRREGGDQGRQKGPSRKSTYGPFTSFANIL